jgi:hypothetical protein
VSIRPINGGLAKYARTGNPAIPFRASRLENLYFIFYSFLNEQNYYSF